MSLPALGALPCERRGYARCGGLQIHYREMGTGPCVVLVHQAPWASIQYRRVMPLMAKAGFRVIVPDLPGHAMSDALDMPSIEGFAEILPGLLATVGEDSAAIAGQHGGALVAARMAAEFPKLVMGIALDNAPLYTDERRAQRAAMIDESHVIAPDGSHLTDRWATVRRIADPDWSDESVHVAVLTWAANGPTREHGHHAVVAYRVEPDLPRVACPALIIGSRRDPVFPAAAQLRALRPDWDYAEFDGGAGMILDRPDEWCAPIVTFLRFAAK